MLVDGAKYGDVEIPVFCYEPKLGAAGRRLPHVPRRDRGHPEAADRLLDAGQGRHGRPHADRRACSEAQEAVVEFLLDQPPARLPGLRQGRRVPAAGHLVRLGRRHARASSSPSATSRSRSRCSPLIAIDRERCILCYRCVRFTQEVAEDYQLVLHERGAHTYVATFDGHPYVAPFSGNIIELCPVGALTSQPYRFRARPWDIEGAGSVCTLCPAQCNVSFTVRDERVLRVLARDNAERRRRLAVRQGPLRLPGDPRRRAHHRSRWCATAASCARSRWERALERGRARRSARAQRPRRRARRRRDDQRGGLPRCSGCVREGARLADIDSRAGGGARRSTLQRALAAPALQATVPDLEFAHAVLVLDAEPVDDAPILDLRIRKGVRRHGVKLAVATSRPVVAGRRTPQLSLRFAPGAGEAFARRARRRARRRGGAPTTSAARRGGRRRRRRGPRARRRCCASAGEDVVILWGERLLARPARRPRRPRAAERRRPPRACAARDGAGLLEVPAGAERPRPARGRRAAERRPGPRRAPRRGPRRRADRAAAPRPAS